MEITEICTNSLDIDNNVICEYFNTLEDEELPSIEGLMSFVNYNYFVEDFEDYSEVSYKGDEKELLEIYNEFLSNND